MLSILGQNKIFIQFQIRKFIHCQRCNRTLAALNGDEGSSIPVNCCFPNNLSFQIEVQLPSDQMLRSISSSSVVGAQPCMETVAKENLVTIMDHEEGCKTEEIAVDPLVIPCRIMELWTPQLIEELPEAFCGSWVGYFSYDTMRYVEKKKLPFANAPFDDRGLPDVHLGLYDNVIVFDHVKKKAYVIHWVRLDRYSAEEALNDGMDRLETLVSRFHFCIYNYSFQFQPKAACLQAKEHILAGDIFQIVLSQRFERRTFADPFEVYRALRIVNPSPYMTYLQREYMYIGCFKSRNTYTGEEGFMKSIRKKLHKESSALPFSSEIYCVG
ncbi:hypothetical protein TSUD_207450 [Trifolium subterraneum]|uniref:Anthranilate synthase component I N-terminal domain-containing protein n=1 Tax=Trifolium subterraneum TaxID=3900 RepID=A0A2Z6P009_TRISU|nr:hypothetical protein TSUD_207450 [Trifolium subterraneum]